MKRKNKRLYMISAALLALGGATALILAAFEDNIVFFYSPTEIINSEAPKARSFRIGGLVVENSVTDYGEGI